MLTVSGAFVGVIDDWLKSAGYGASPLSLRIRRIKPDQVVDILTVEAMLEEVVATSGQTSAPMAIGQLIDKKHLSSIWHMLATARTLEEMLNSYVFYESLFYGVNIANVRRNDNGMELYWNVKDAPRHYARLAMSAFVTITRRMGMPATAITSVSFPFNDKDQADQYRVELGCHQIHFDRELGIQFHREALHLAIDIQTDEKTKETVVKELMPELEDVDFAVRLYDEIAAALPQKQANLKAIAIKLAISERTLQRRLDNIDDGLRASIGRIRMHLARAYLMDEGMNLVAVSLMLGYSEQSAFQLAFRRFHGVSPGRWRKSALGV
ncbi:MAG: AraC family transcriptional regulator [Halioglobus sp.]